MDSIKNFIKDVSNGVFRDGIHKISGRMRTDERFQKTYDWLYSVYVVDGQGFKSIIKDYNLDVGYTFLRNFVNYLGFPKHSNCEANDFLRNRRSNIAQQNYIDKTGFFRDGVQESIHHKSKKRGIQGYYWNNSLNKYVWLRSSWEFIYAKWLNKQKNIVWDVECKEYLLSDNTYYRPDFFIFGDNNEIVKIIEIKGYWKNRAYKVKLLRDEYNVNAIIIDDVRPYAERTLNEEISTWKKLRKLDLSE